MFLNCVLDTLHQSVIVGRTIIAQNEQKVNTKENKQNMQSKWYFYWTKIFPNSIYSTIYCWQFSRTS